MFGWDSCFQSGFGIVHASHSAECLHMNIVELGEAAPGAATQHDSGSCGCVCVHEIRFLCLLTAFNRVVRHVDFCCSVGQHLCLSAFHKFVCIQASCFICVYGVNVYVCVYVYSILLITLPELFKILQKKASFA